MGTNITVDDWTVGNKKWEYSATVVFLKSEESAETVHAIDGVTEKDYGHHW